MPLTRFRALLHGSSRYSERMSAVYEQTFVSSSSVGQQAAGIARLALIRKAGVGNRVVLCVLGSARVVPGGRRIRAIEAPGPVLLKLARTGAEQHERTVAGAGEGVPGLGRAMDEVPLTEWTLLPLHDQHAFAREDEEILLLGLPVVRPGRLTGADNANRHPQHREKRLRLVFVVARQRHA